eukprot:6196399-Pleurochrysis_carterae.AAC.1
MCERGAARARTSACRPPHVTISNRSDPAHRADSPAGQSHLNCSPSLRSFARPLMSTHHCMNTESPKAEYHAPSLLRQGIDSRVPYVSTSQLIVHLQTEGTPSARCEAGRQKFYIQSRSLRHSQQPRRGWNQRGSEQQNDNSLDKLALFLISKNTKARSAETGDPNNKNECRSTPRKVQVGLQNDPSANTSVEDEEPNELCNAFDCDGKQ